MMQNLPFLVAKANPVNNEVTSKQANKMAEKPEGSNSFKQVLSKQVEQDAAKKTAEKSNQQASNKAGEKKAPVTDSERDDVEKPDVDAQLLATTVTAKTIQDVTDGEVVLDTAKTDIPKAEQATDALAKTGEGRNAEVSPVLMTNLTPTVPVDAKVVSKDVSTEAVIDDALPQTKTADKGVVLDDKAVHLKELPTEARDAAVEHEKGANRQFANFLAGENKLQSAAQESSASQSVSSVMDASALAATTMQLGPKLQTVPTTESAGFSNLINVSPGKAGWSEAIGQKVVWMVGAAEQSATLTLNPKDLGPLQVIINVNNEKADATFISENPEVRKALEEGMSNLRQSMGQAGVELGQANVNTSKQHQDFQQASKEYAARHTHEGGASQEHGEVSSGPVRTRVSNGLVDTFV